MSNKKDFLSLKLKAVSRELNSQRVAVPTFLIESIVEPKIQTPVPICPRALFALLGDIWLECLRFRCRLTSHVWNFSPGVFHIVLEDLLNLFVLYDERFLRYGV